MIAVNNITFSYAPQTELLRDISFELGEGHFLAVLGNNGAGKSTLLKCLNSILPTRSGSVRLLGRDIKQMTRRDIARTAAYVEQHTKAGKLTVFDTVLLGRVPYMRAEPTDEDILVTENAISRMGLEDYRLRYTDELSGGEYQKVVIARALAQQPKLMLLDEPTAALDLHNQHEVMKTIKGIVNADHISAAVIIHDINLAVRYCDRFLLLHNGGVFAYGGEEVITEENISRVYEIPVFIMEAAGHKMVAVQ